MQLGQYRKYEQDLPYLTEPARYAIASERGQVAISGTGDPWKPETLHTWAPKKEKEQPRKVFYGQYLPSMAQYQMR